MSNINPGDVSSKKTTAGICAILLGALGVHKFILAFYWQIIKNRKLHIISLLTILIYYILRLYQMSQTAELYFAFMDSPLGKLLYGFNIN